MQEVDSTTLKKTEENPSSKSKQINDLIVKILQSQMHITNILAEKSWVNRLSNILEQVLVANIKPEDVKTTPAEYRHLAMIMLSQAMIILL